MNTSDYIRQSETGRAMADYCKKQGLTYSVMKPGSKGHPFFCTTSNGEQVKIPFSLTPSDRNAGKAAVRALVRALDGLAPEPVSTEIETAETGAPKPPAGTTVSKKGVLRGDKEAKARYREAREAFVCKRLLDGASPQVIAAEITAAGAVYAAKSVNVAGFRLRGKGLLPPDFTVPGVPYKRRKPRADTIERELLPIRTMGGPLIPNMHKAVVAEMEADIFPPSVLDRMRTARTESAQAADDLARVLYEEIADARRAVEIELVQVEQDAKHAAILDALTK